MRREREEDVNLAYKPKFFSFFMSIRKKIFHIRYRKKMNCPVAWAAYKITDTTPFLQQNIPPFGFLIYRDLCQRLPVAAKNQPQEEDVYSIGYTSSFYFSQVHLLSAAVFLTTELMPRYGGKKLFTVGVTNPAKHDYNKVVYVPCF